MAKLDSVFRYQGTFKKVTRVNSNTWGDHIRAARGTYKKAELNDGFRKSGAETKIANMLAKTIKDLYLPYMQDFKDSMMWSRLLSIFKLQLSRNQHDPSKLEEFEFNNNALRHLIMRREVEASIDNSTLQLAVTSRCVSKLPMTDSYQQTFVVTFYTNRLEGIGTALADSVIHPRGGEAWYDHRASFEIPDDASLAMVGLKAVLIHRGKVVHVAEGGMNIVKVLDMGLDK